MQDIKRSELLDRLAAGWKVRRKSWDTGWAVTKNGGTVETPALLALLSDDWEGMPPEPVLKREGLHIVTAYSILLSGNATYIRREDWDDSKRVEDYDHPLPLTGKDILSTDWEAWV